MMFNFVKQIDNITSIHLCIFHALTFHRLLSLLCWLLLIRYLSLPLLVLLYVFEILETATEESIGVITYVVSHSVGVDCLEQSEARNLVEILPLLSNDLTHALDRNTVGANHLLEVVFRVGFEGTTMVLFRARLDLANHFLA